MAENRYANKCFIFTPDGYEEITYTELCRRRETNQSYEGKKFIPLHGMLMEVTQEQYQEFYQDRRRQKYLDERSKGNGDISIDMLTTPEFNGEDILVSSEDVEEQAVHRILVESLRSCLTSLTADEQDLIKALFYDGHSERAWSAKSGIPQKTINDRKRRILDKLRKMMKI